MRTLWPFAAVVGLGLAACFAPPAAVAQDAPPPGVEIAARAPIHEAYAEPVHTEVKASLVITKEPPEPIDEMPPAEKPEGDHITWVPGYWNFNEEKGDFMWISGFWRGAPPDRQWAPGHWAKLDSGWQWTPGFWALEKQADVSYLPPPPATLEVAPPPPAPRPDVIWVNGSWVYRADHYAWRPGYYLAFRPSWLWVPAHFVWSPCGYVFVDGYWDYTLRDRGVLYAPVYVTAEVYRRPGYVYSPVMVIHDEHLYGSMFVRPGYTTYYYGDYFDAGCRGNGYVAWCDVRVGGGGDPMFCYYQQEHRSDPQWSLSLTLCFKGRYDGSIARPSQTNITNVNYNTTIINNIQSTTVVNQFASPRMVASPAELKASGVKLQPLSKEAREAHHAEARHIVEASHERSKQEAAIRAQGPMKAGDKPRAAVMKMAPPPPKAKLPPERMPPAAHSDTHPTSPNPAAHPGTPVTPPGHPATPATPPATHPGTPATPPATHPTTPATTPATHPATPTTPAATPPHPAAATPPATTPPATHPATPTTPAATPPHPAATTPPATTPPHPAAATPAVTPAHPATATTPAAAHTTTPPAHATPPPAHTTPPPPDKKDADKKDDKKPPSQ